MEIWKKEKASIKWDDEEEKKEFEDLLKELCENKSRKLKFTSNQLSFLILFLSYIIFY